MAGMAENPFADYYSTPADLGASLLDFINDVDGWSRINFGVPVLDQAIETGLYPGSLTSIVARPGHGKSLYAKAVIKRECERIIAARAEDTECAIMVTLEEPPERIAAEVGGWPWSISDIINGDFDLGAARTMAGKQTKIPLFTIQHPRVSKGKKPAPLTADTVYQIIEMIATDHGRKPTLVALDYIQILHADNMPRDQQTLTTQVTSAVVGAKDLAIRLGCPVVIGVQAGRSADDRNPPVPEMSDLQWASAIEQASDIILSLWRPFKTHNGKTTEITIPGQGKYDLTDRLTVVKILKQRIGVGSGKFAVDLNYNPVELTEARSKLFG